MGRGMLDTGGFCTCEHLVWMKEATMIGARETVNMPLRLAVFYPSIKDLRQIANGKGEQGREFTDSSHGGLGVRSLHIVYLI